MGVHNGAKYLSEAIDSILSQSFRDFEFIIIDDGSTDATAEILGEFSRRDSRLQCISLDKNLGLPHALNLGIQKASGNIIARMDCDDVSGPERFELQLAAMETSGADLLGTFAFSLSSNGATKVREPLPVTEDGIALRLPHSNCIVHPSVMVKKTVLEDVGGYNEEFLNSQDYDLWLRLLPQARMNNLDVPLIGYRRHNGQISARKSRGKQTHYSVCAALSHFRVGFDMDRISPKEDVAVVVNGFTEVFQADLTPRVRQCLNGHVIRYARKCVRDKDQRKALRDLLFTTATFREKCKWQLYQLTG
ncbi:glycosyltransferase family 2 protein [Parasedimentitalea psychrophila]|uniref:Glycosyltransferase n=1 Tax=Parasedimentitalea psychrophila TaxID=2997337 RepID=A0A9Y2L333_9RHOB|nr:glycosyltransferase [Parasedimentitalea psychrophila]WIY27085.1 glycosyltransferase [Parasedimentitalea psychrophila]